ncbi:MAG TPA: ACP phosphodiesterase, partial [Thermoanaerobaculia bacterium]|nr:ACP phosphodiesterase [Thermoanaerobaculia bacterium]
MNHLAHLFLGGTTAESLLGNIAGDFVKGPLRDRFSQSIRAGIMQHRHIDEFTDTHPDVASFRRVMTAEWGHYSRVIADVFFDHFLAGDFELYAGEPLDAFLVRTYALLDPHVERMPGRLRLVYPRMRDEGWLLSYRRLEGVHAALYHMSRRFSRQPRLERATAYLTHSRSELHGHFASFLPDVIAFARSL